MNLFTNFGTMKWVLLILTVLFVSCTRKVIITEAGLKPDIFYKEGDYRPFTGKCLVLFSDKSLVKDEFTYRHGRLHGVAISWYRNGRIRRKGYYEQGMISGNWEFWDASGNKIMEAAYLNDHMTLYYPAMHKSKE